MPSLKSIIYVILLTKNVIPRARQSENYFYSRKNVYWKKKVILVPLYALQVRYNDLNVSKKQSEDDDKNNVRIFGLGKLSRFSNNERISMLFE